MINIKSLIAFCTLAASISAHPLDARQDVMQGHLLFSNQRSGKPSPFSIDVPADGADHLISLQYQSGYHNATVVPPASDVLRNCCNSVSCTIKDNLGHIIVTLTDGVTYGSLGKQGEAVNLLGWTASCHM